MSRARRIYLYKMVCDNGGAPCDQEGLLSLAICKPGIRVSARVGDLVLGFVGKTMQRDGSAPADHALVYALRVTQLVAGNEYYDAGYSKRRDAIYHWDGSEFVSRRNDYHDADGIDHDLGKNRDRTQVLLSNDYRYFGREAKSLDKFARVARCVEHMARGHLVNHDEELVEDLGRLEVWLWSLHPSRNTKSINKLRTLAERDDDGDVYEVRCGR